MHEPSTLKQRFQQADPDAFFLDRDEPGALEDYLHRHLWLQHGERIKSIEKAGEGNMNLVLRITTGQRSFIIKQSRPWVEKYPHILAPLERAIVEGQFYQLIKLNQKLRHFTPDILGMDVHSSIILLQDLGQAKDYNLIYRKGKELKQDELDDLVTFISELHSSYNTDVTRERITNRSMRALNHEHLFVFPLEEDNGFDLDTVLPGLQQVAMPYKQDALYKEKVRLLGNIYLDDGPVLLHGDYYPGSWLQTDNGLKVIDPEFCFFGPAEFDLGVCIAHLLMAQQPEEFIGMLLRNYYGRNEIDFSLLANFTGVEIMRRLIGLAQQPVDLSLKEREALLQESRQLILQPEHSVLINLL